MKPEESPPPTPPPASEPALARETPEVEALLRHYRSRARARRQRRRQHMLLAGGGLLGAGVLVLAVLGGFPRVRDHSAPPSGPATAPGPPPRAVAHVVSDTPLGTAESTTPATGKQVTARQSPTMSPTRSTPLTGIVRAQPGERLTAIRQGDPKERVFELFASTVERQQDMLVPIDGMRLRAKGRSPDHPQVEVADVEIAERGSTRRYWFLFGEGQLIAWGRPEEWQATAARLRLDVDYR